MKSNNPLTVAFLFAALGCSSLLGCSPQVKNEVASGSAPFAPATLEDLGTVRLSPKAVEALGLQVSPVVQVLKGRGFSVGGEVMVAAGRDVLLAAPASGKMSAIGLGFPQPGQAVKAGEKLFSLIPLASVDRDVRAQATRERDTAQARLELSQKRLSRAESMLDERSGSQRAVEEAVAQEEIDAATLRAADSRLRTLASGSLDSDLALTVRSPVDGLIRAVRVAPGQSVPQGAALIEIAGSGRWVKASFAGSDVQELSHLEQVRASRLGSSESIPLSQISSPPAADLVRGTVDHFFALPETAAWEAGERVTIQVVTQQESARLAVPAEAVLRDAEGATWVYAARPEGRFRRRRVEVLRAEGQLMLLEAGLEEGASVVSAGAVELWGFELGADR